MAKEATQVNGADYSIEQLEEMLKAKKEQVKQSAPQMAAKLDAYCRKEFGMPFMSVVAACRKPPEQKIFVNPNDKGERYEYSGKGKLPPKVSALSKEDRAKWLQA